MKKNENKKDALARAAEMMQMPMKQLPALAFAYMQKMCHTYAACGEVILTAFAHYAQLEEGLPCDDFLYRPGKKEKQLFKEVKASLTK